MYRLLGTWVMRVWPIILIGWVACLVVLVANKPRWEDVIEEGEFAFLPAEMPSLQAERLYQDTWGEPQASRVVIVARREGQKLTAEDRDFIANRLRPSIEQVVTEVGIPKPTAKAGQAESKADAPADSEPEAVGKFIKTFASPSYEKVLDSTEGTATMVLINLRTEFFDARNTTLIDRLEALINPNDQNSLYRRKADDGKSLVPAGLHLALSGDATVGRDMMRAATESSKATETWTVVLVVALLLIIYRAPILALIPLITVGVATEFSLATLSFLGKYEIVGLFNGIEVYVKILSYGAGVDYCLFLIARFKEELDEGLSSSEAVGNAIAKVGHALVASAGTVICGIGMMIFADFQKFSQAGVAITLGLVVVLVASMTFTPALLRWAGRWAFWPQMATSEVRGSGGWVSATGMFASLLRRNVFETIWQRIGELIVQRPMSVLLSSTMIMVPFAIIAVLFRSHLSYGLLSELPQDKASVLGAKAIQDHYAAGIAGPITILLRCPDIDFTSEDGAAQIKALTESLYNRKDDLKLADVRSLMHPFGIAQFDPNAPEEPLTLERRIQKRVEEHEVRKVYLGQVGDGAEHVTRLDLVFSDDPFSRGSIARFQYLVDTIETTARKLVDRDNAEVFAFGPTASLADLKTTTDRDAVVVDSLVLLGVFLILLVLLRQFIVSVYLIVSVFFSYLVTLGVTFAVFWMMDPSGFSGLDWKVPTFLFTILIAVGEDYNIFLMTRIQEEQLAHGPIDGVPLALTKTGSIISSCGVIMAGTFLSLLAGTLVGMHQLGFALAFGVLLDTFVVRPILVPAFLVLLYDGRFKSVRALMGASPSGELVMRNAPPAPAPEPER